ncbi:hypothetical protein H5410_027067 [Solanum commersonii]|uniref:Uncharacterized protein n=1 Tax=Solanum commersonii TaxID=4109 RepID=A0A9J5Z0W9_SOLCO|nr:hypothetical protein H5410_027067 [Solanum commersonii]
MEQACLETYSDGGKRVCHHYDGEKNSTLRPLEVESQVPGSYKVGHGISNRQSLVQTSHVGHSGPLSVGSHVTLVESLQLFALDNS